MLYCNCIIFTYTPEGVKTVGYYKKAKCDICGEETGFKGNKCFVLSDGHMCQTCACRSSPSELKYLAWRAFARATVSEIKLSIALRDEVGDEEWEKRLKQEAYNRTAQYSPIGTTAKCPRCGSASVSASTRGFGIGKAVVGAYIAGPIGLLAGNIGAKKVRITCLNCGHQWYAGKA